MFEIGDRVESMTINSTEFKGTIIPLNSVYRGTEDIGNRCLAIEWDFGSKTLVMIDDLIFAADYLPEEITQADQEFISSVIDLRVPLGLFLLPETDSWTAVDNSVGEAFTENFKRRDDAINWLRGNFDVI